MYKKEKVALKGVLVSALVVAYKKSTKQNVPRGTLLKCVKNYQ